MYSVELSCFVLKEHFEMFSVSLINLLYGFFCSESLKTIAAMEIKISSVN